MEIRGNRFAEFSPIMHDAHLSWVTEPWYMRLFLLYLVIVGCVALMSCLKLARLLYSFTRRKRLSLEDIRDDITVEDLTVRLALADKIVYEPVAEEPGNPKLTARSVS